MMPNEFLRQPAIAVRRAAHIDEVHIGQWMQIIPACTSHVARSVVRPFRAVQYWIVITAEEKVIELASVRPHKSGRKPGREKSQYFVAGGDRRLTRSIDEMLSDDAVRAAYVLGEKRRDVCVRSAVGQLARDEAVSERRRVRRKALCPAEFVSFESIGEYRQVLPVEALANSPDLIGRDFQPCRLLERQ